MRSTSGRRTTVIRYAYLDLGRVKGPPAAPENARDVTSDDDDAVVCGSCGSRVRPLASDPARPRAHAPGGLSTNTRLGRYKCPGSGNDGPRYAS